MGADYSFELISIETYAPQFIVYNKLFLGSVIHICAAVCIVQPFTQLEVSAAFGASEENCLTMQKDA